MKSGLGKFGGRKGELEDEVYKVRFRLRGSTCRTFSCVLVIRKVRTGPLWPRLIILYVSETFMKSHKNPFLRNRPC